MLFAHYKTKLKHNLFFKTATKMPVYVSVATNLTLCFPIQMWLCRGNGAQVHNSERDPETRTAACETQLRARACYVSLFLSFEHSMWSFLVSGNQSGSVQYQHRRALCHPQRVYPFTVLQVSLLTGGCAGASNINCICFQ